MDFDSVITLFFILIFFVLPSLFKQIMARKNKTGEPKPVKENPSLFDRIREQIQKFVRDLEEQARQQRQGSKEQDTVWEGFIDEETDSDFDHMAEETAVAVPVPAAAPPKSRVERVVKHEKTAPYRQKEICTKQPGRKLSNGLCYKSNPLQNAIVWSEILSKPKALRDR